MTFEDYMDDFEGMIPELMSDEQLKRSRESYESLMRKHQTDKTPVESAKHEKALSKAKELRKLAKFYGGKALTGTAPQKKWGEEIREKVLLSSALSEEQKSELASIGGVLGTAKFWINNRDKSPETFKLAVIRTEYRKLHELSEKHYDTLVRTGPTHTKEIARKEIYETLSSLKIAVTYDFPNCDFYDNFGALKKGMKFRV